MLVQVRLRFRLARYLTLGCRQNVAIYGLRQSVAKDGDRTSCQSSVKMSFYEDYFRIKFRSKRIYLAPIERKISSFGDADGDGQYLDSNGNRVNVGNCDAKGVNVNNNWDDNPNGNIGLAASRKSKSCLQGNYPAYAG